ncbi:MAG TPA: hypothetical protein DCQ98_00020 [Planctomycetaceae bacterium]|nr:hypothetical protein [Planctomycetaceae bacterium]
MTSGEGKAVVGTERARTVQLGEEPLRESARGPILMVLGGLALLTGIAVLIAVGLNRLLAPIVLPDQLAADGTWLIRVEGKPTLFGAIEVVGTAYDKPSGSARGPHVIGTCDSTAQFQERFGNLRMEADGAYAGRDRIMARPIPQR